MSNASCCCGFSPSAAAGPNVTGRIETRAAQQAIQKLPCDVKCLRLSAANISPSKNAANLGESRQGTSPASGSNILDSHRIPVTVAEMGSHIIHNGGNLFVVHHRAERWHCALSVDDDSDGISAGFEIAVAGQRWI